MYGAIACVRGGKHCGDAAAAAAAATSKTDLLHGVLLATVDAAQLLVVTWHLVVRDERVSPYDSVPSREPVTDRSARTLSHKADDRQRVLPLAPSCLKVNVTDL